MRSFASFKGPKDNKNNCGPKCDHQKPGGVAKDQSEAAAMEGAKDFLNQTKNFIDEIQ